MERISEYYSDPGNNPLLYEDWAISDLFRDKRQRSLISIIVFQLKTLLITSHMFDPSHNALIIIHQRVKQLDYLSQSWSVITTRMRRNLIPELHHSY